MKRKRVGAGVNIIEGRIIIDLTKQRKLKPKCLQRDMPKKSKALCPEEPMKPENLETPNLPNVGITWN